MSNNNHPPLPLPAPCRGRTGHQLVAELGMSMLSDATWVKVERILSGMTAAQAGNWMDEIRDDQKYKYTEPWHYVNIDQGQSYKPAPKGDVITALNKAYTELQHIEKLTPEQVKFDVLVLFHLCGDLMQPMHVGYGSDRGGTGYQVQYSGRGTNLHSSIWDSWIINKEHITLADLGSSKVKVQLVNFITWLNEDRALLPSVYDIKNRKVENAYLTKNKPVVITQLKDGGDLLANCLEVLYSKVSNVPAGPATPAPSATQQPAKPGKTMVSTGTITPDQAAAHIGETVKVCGKVFGVRALDSRPTFLNMGGVYSDNPFTAVIMFNKRGNFSYKPEEFLQGKTICVTGMVKNYKGKPEIVVDKEGQVEVQ